MTKVYPKVEVVWVDAEEQGDIGWNNLKEQLKNAKKPAPIMKNIGYEIHRNDDHISLLHSIGKNECSSVEKIPISCVKEIILLNEVGKNE